MTLQDLIATWRADVDDATQPYLWSEAEAMDFANDAQIEACRRGRLLVDSTTAGIARVDVAATAAGLVTLDPRVLFVRRARFAGKLPLRRMTMQDMEELNPFWQDAQPGEPSVFITDYETGKLLLWPAPTADAPLMMTTVRDPLVDMNDALDEPEVPARAQRSLRHWMAFRAYSKQDSEANDPKKAADSLALFEQEFGKKSSAIDEAWIAREQVEFDGTF